MKSLSEPKTLTDMVKEVELTRQTLSKHLKAMEAKGLVARGYEKRGRGRPRAIFIAVKKREETSKASLLEGLKRQDLILVKFGALRKLCRLNREEFCTKTGRGCRLKNCLLAIRE